MKKAVPLLLIVLGAAGVLAAADKVDVSTATGKTITYDNRTGIAVIEGNAVVQNSSGTLKADRIEMNAKEKHGRADGNVVVVQSSATLTGTHADYNWATSSGTVQGATGIGDPWNFNAQELVLTSDKLYQITDGEVTSCTANPPHYHIASKHGVVRPGKRLTLYNADLVMEDTPSFWLPVYTKSLVPKKYRLRIQPGNSSRDGFTNKTVLGYPYTTNSWTDLRWDYLQRTGNGGGINHRYFAPRVKGDFDAYYIRDSNPDVEVPRSKRYTILWNHYHQLTNRLSMNARADLKSDQSFGNSFGGVGNGVLVESQKRGLISDGGFTYQLPSATLQAQFERKDKFDSTVSSKQFISKVTLPRLLYNSAPLQWKYFPIYTSFNASYLNDTLERTDPDVTLRYKRNIVTGVDFRKDIRVKKTTTLTPVVGYSETWNNRVLASTYVVTEKDQYVGRYTLGGDLRRRLNRSMTGSLKYRYGVRFEANRTNPDVEADDYGVETNQVNGDVTTRIGRNTLLTLASGYDYRQDPRNAAGKYKHVSARVLSPTADLQWEIRPRVVLYFRETYSIFDQRTQTPINTPANTSGEIQLGDPLASTFFSQGFSYTKKAFGNPSELFLNNKLKFYLTKKWYVDLIVSYRAEGETKLQYTKVRPIERTIRVVRDLHCWILRMEFSKRPDRSDASFYIDLKAGASASKNVFDRTHQNEYSTSTRHDGPELDQLFPTGQDE